MKIVKFVKYYFAIKQRESHCAILFVLWMVTVQNSFIDCFFCKAVGFI